MTDAITTAQSEGRINGVLLEEGERQRIAFGDLEVVVQGLSTFHDLVARDGLGG